MARAAGLRGRVLTLELDAKLCEIARTFAAEAGLSERIEVRQGPRHRRARANRRADRPGLRRLRQGRVRRVPRARRSEALRARRDHRRQRALEGARREERRAAERSETHRGAPANPIGMLTTHPSLRGVVLPLGDGVAYAVKTT